MVRALTMLTCPWALPMGPRLYLSLRGSLSFLGLWICEFLVLLHSLSKLLLFFPELVLDPPFLFHLFHFFYLLVKAMATLFSASVLKGCVFLVRPLSVSWSASACSSLWSSLALTITCWIPPLFYMLSFLSLHIWLTCGFVSTGRERSQRVCPVYKREEEVSCGSWHHRCALHVWVSPL